MRQSLQELVLSLRALVVLCETAVLRETDDGRYLAATARLEHAKRVLAETEKMLANTAPEGQKDSK